MSEYCKPSYYTDDNRNSLVYGQSPNYNYTPSVNYNSISFTPDGRKLREASENPVIVLKGGYDKAETRIVELLDELKPYSGTEIKNLPPHIGAKFNQLIRYINLLHDTPKYQTLYKLITGKFKDVKTVRPGTVGGYLYGCNSHTSFSEKSPGCAVACAGAMPPPRSDSNYQRCQNTVISAKFNGHGYHFTVLNRSQGFNHENAYLYIEESSNKGKNPYHRGKMGYVGFSPEEKAYLKKTLGMKKVKLLSFDFTGRSYTELTNELTPIDKLRDRYKRHGPPVYRSESDYTDVSGYSSNSNHRDIKGDSRKHYDEPSAGSNAVWIIFAVIIILVIFFVVWQFYKGSDKTEY